MKKPTFQTNRFLKEFSTFAIGGPCQLFTCCYTEEEMRAALLYSYETHTPFLILGKGSNAIFSDKGFNGLVIQNKLEEITIEGEEVCAQSGYRFSHLGAKTARSSLSGLEFACGIPATVGGAIYMNAGANGYETQDVLKEVVFLDERGNRETFSKQDLCFSYRYSSFQYMKGVIVSARFLLKKDDNARYLKQAILEKRKKTQPLSEKSAGCIFKNPSKKMAASYLIDRCGLKGRRKGDAEVSSLHANFIINKGSATAKDVFDLIEHVKEEVFCQTQILLETEVRYIHHEP